MLAVAKLIGSRYESLDLLRRIHTLNRRTQDALRAALPEYFAMLDAQKALQASDSAKKGSSK
ncbi:MAG TPA: hypothetical protein VGJ84_15385, partial [Polyangiaceae bacterium]|jgi:hypothetical protein